MIRIEPKMLLSANPNGILISISITINGQTYPGDSIVITRDHLDQVLGISKLLDTK